ncbi:MAG TPA: CsbD family protein [Usitatibacter sp.]|nr:CsbD family protein [Usitatibacter sp.]
MNRDQAKGTMKDVAGKIQRKTGELTGNGTQQLKGAAKQVVGKVQKTVGDVREDSKKPPR